MTAHLRQPPPPPRPSWWIESDVQHDYGKFGAKAAEMARMRTAEEDARTQAIQRKQGDR